MTQVNENFLKLQSGYLFPEISRRKRAFQKANPNAQIISMGIGDVTQPLAPAVVEAMKRAVEKMGRKETFRGYDDSGVGYEFLRQAIRKNDYNTRGVDIQLDEIFISDGGKCDTANIQELFAQDNIVAVSDPVYPVYVDTNVMAGRTGGPVGEGRYERIVYMPCTVENGFVPDLPDKKVDLVYLCFPNNPTGAVATKQQLERWVSYARDNKSIILFDAAYEAFISDPQIPHSIYEIDGAKEAAIEFRSYSKTAGFTGLRCAFSVVPRQLKAYTRDGKPIDVNSLWARRHCTKFNGVSYVTQVGAAATYTDEGKKQVKETIAIYMNNAKSIRESLQLMGYTVYGGVNAPYLWLQTANGLSSWQFFDLLLEKAHVLVTPGAGFGAAGEGFVRISAFADPPDVKVALDRIKAIS
jgi:LL-diaminopimelate aminotransferase